MINLFIYICLLNTFSVLSNSQDFPEVKIEQGVLRGKHRQTWNGRTFNSFSGIPYAEPPIDNLRFKPPVPAGPWQGVLNATDLSPICPQVGMFETDGKVIGTEDCLYLNVYTPQLKNSSNQLFPVLLYIHGGGFFEGSGNPDSYGPDILLDKDIVLVTINYRLGPLGFLSTEDEFLPGNWGLKDQNLALKWVKKNIVHFGGDPNKITIFGQSAGGVSVHLHVLSPLSKDLINGAIAHSGVATVPWAILPKGEALTNAKRLAGFLNCTSESKKEMVECLSKVDAKDIMAQDRKFTVFHWYPIMPFRPVIEPKVDGAFISEDPIDIIKSGKSANIPFVSGVTTQEGAWESSVLYKNYTLIEQLNNGFTKLAPIVFIYENHPCKDEITKKIKQFYFEDKNIDNSTIDALTNLFTDTWWLIPQVTAIEWHTKYTTHPVYYYIFGIRGRLSFAKLFGESDYDYGVCHGDELFYLFSTEMFPDYKPDDSEKKCNDIMTNIWTSFALTGSPTPATNPLIRNKWDATKCESLTSYFFNTIDDIKMVEGMYKERIEFWKNLLIDSKI